MPLEDNSKKRYFYDLSRSEKAGIYTFTTLVLILVSLIIVTLDPEERKEEDVFVEIIFDEQLFPEEKQLEDEPKQKEKQKGINIESHSGYNEASNKYEQELDQFKTLEEIRSQKNQSMNISKSDLYKDNYTVMMLSERRIHKTKDWLDKKDTPPSEKKTNSSVSYNLVKRFKIHLPAPIYTCKDSGTVVVNILVNQEGVVTRARVNTSKTNTRNGCLIENALQYAQESLFNNDSEALKLQSGTITYYFVRKRY